MNWSLTAKIIAFAAFVLSLMGCASITGTGGSDKYGCKAPDGVLCSSVGGVYANSIQNNLPAQKAATGHADDKVQFIVAPAQSVREPMTTGSPIRSAPRVLRVWVAPWEDSDGDLRDQSYFYVTVDGGRWLIERNRQNIRDEYAPIAPPTQSKSLDAPAAPASDTTGKAGHAE